jgi:hypothetical protein
MGFLARNGCLFWPILEKTTYVVTVWRQAFIEKN